MRQPFNPRDAWAIKPPLGSQINAGHDLANGIQECYLFNELGGKNVQNIGPSGVGPLTLSSTYSWPNNLPMPYMAGMAVGGASSQTCISPATVQVTNQTTLVLAFSRTANAVANGVYVLVRQANSVNNEVILQDDATPTNLNCSMANSVGVLQTASIALTNIGNNINYLIIATYDRTTGNVNAWLNGKAFAHSGSAVTGTTTTGYTIACGANTTGSGSQAQVQSLLIKYNRLLAAQEAAQLYENPWCMIAPPALRRYWVVPAAGGIVIENRRSFNSRTAGRTLRPYSGGI